MKCGALIKSLTQEVYHHFVVGMDGSAASQIPFQTALAMRKAKGKLYVLHIEDINKNKYLSNTEKWSSISETCESYLAPMIPRHCYSLNAIMKSPNESTKSAFVNHVNSVEQAVFVCLGWHGRKGVKEDPTVLGSVADVSMKSCAHPVIICKKVPDFEKPQSYIICVDGDTQRGMWAFEAITALSRRYGGCESRGGGCERREGGEDSE